ncbi:MAG: endonuclease domain-containing protein [Patescibacteria group bacterium]|nr:endonuclease domain-containing protein [Patescibacteria group bacterium]
MSSYRVIRTEFRRYLRKNQTEAERVMWIYLQKMRYAGYIFRRQHSIDRYIADFYCPKVKLAIELDGGIHDRPEQQRKDNIRDAIIKSHGVTILRFKNHEVTNDPNQALVKIRKTLDQLNAPPSP